MKSFADIREGTSNTFNESLTELHKKTLSNYIEKAAQDVADRSMSSAFDRMHPKGKARADKKQRKVGYRLKGIRNATKKLSEGSARGGYTKRGAYAKTHEYHRDDQEHTQARKGIADSPKTDARSYARTHESGYNKASHEREADRHKAETHRHPTEKSTVPLPKKEHGVSDRMKELMAHPHYKKIASR